VDQVRSAKTGWRFGPLRATHAPVPVLESSCTSVPARAADRSLVCAEAGAGRLSTGGAGRILFTSST